MQILRKILKKNLAKISATQDIILSLTDSLELFFNDAEGNQLKITDIIICNSKNEIADIENKIPNKFYYAKKEADLGLYINDTEGIVYLKADLSLQIDQLNTSVSEISDNITSMTKSINNAFDNVNNTISNMSEDFTNRIDTINEALSVLQQTTSDLNSAIQNIDNSILDLTNATKTNSGNIEKISVSLDELKETVAGLGDSIVEINASIENISKSITALTERITKLEENDTVQDEKIEEHTNAINSIKASINSKKFNSIYDVENLKKTKLEPEIFVPAYIFDATDELFISKLKLRTRTLAMEDITFNITYMAINSDGSVADEISIMEVTLPANNYEVNRTIDNSFKKGTGYTNGYLNVYIKDAPIDHPEATLMVSLVVREGIVEEESHEEEIQS